MIARVSRMALAVILSLAAAGAFAQATTPAAPAPRIVEIAFTGNKHTEPRTMEREMTVHVGDPADPAAIERSRQAIQDLGLFRSVAIGQEPVTGGVRLRVLVDEKYFLIPAPRADANSDGKYAYGVQLRWYNVLGLNHTMKMTWKKVNRQEAGRSTGTQVDTSYSAPFIFDTNYGLDVSYSHVNEPVDSPPAPFAPYDDVTEGGRVVVSRAFHGDLPASQGWRLGSGVALGHEKFSGTNTPPPPGKNLGLVFDVAYNDRRYNIFSDEGLRTSVEVVTGSEKWGSAYDYTSVTGSYSQAWYVGETPHQSIGVFAQGGTFHGGQSGSITLPYELGGAEDLRGFQHGLLKGNAYYYTGVEYLRPLFIESVRGVVFLESGNTFVENGAFTFSDSYNDVGLGLRIRLSRFVKFEVNLGIAYPLTHRTTGARFFGTGRRDI